MSAGKNGHVRSAKVVIGSQISNIHSGQKRRRLIDTEEPSPTYRTAVGDQETPKREPID